MSCIRALLDGCRGCNHDHRGFRRGQRDSGHCACAGMGGGMTALRGNQALRHMPGIGSARRAQACFTQRKGTIGVIMYRWVIFLLLCLPFADSANGQILRADDVRLVVESSAATDGVVVLNVELDGKSRSIDLAPMRRLEQEFAPFVPAIARGEDRLYEGTVRDAADGWARLSRIDGQWTGLVHDGVTLWFLDPASRHAALASARGWSAGATIAYRSNDLDLPDGFDLGGAGEPVLPDHAGFAAPPPLLLGAPRYLKLTLVLDMEFQAVHGASFASVAASILNGVDGLYRAQTDVQVSLHHLRALASNGTLTSSSPATLLDAFTDLLPSSDIPFAGLAHLLSGKDFEGNTVGLAWVGTVCNTEGFGSGIDQMTLGVAGNSAVLAHEIGHNFDADHDSQGNACPASGFIMAAILNLGSPATSFSSCSISTFTQYLSQPRACLDTPPAQASVLFANSFEP